MACNMQNYEKHIINFFPMVKLFDQNGYIFINGINPVTELYMNLKVPVEFYKFPVLEL